MRFPKAGDKRGTGGGDGLAFGDGWYQPVEIHQDAISGLIEGCSIRRGERTMVCVRVLTCRSQSLEGVLALGLICCGEKSRRRRRRLHRRP